MNNEAINKRIQALESELAGLKSELSKTNSFKFDYTAMRTSFIGASCVHNNNLGSSPLNLSNFRYRQLKVNAHADFQLQKELMCIGALAEQIDPNYKYKAKKYCIYYNCENREYNCRHELLTKTLGVAYMPKEVAEKVCEILNNKGVEL